MRAKNVSLKERKQFQLADFRGVDFSSSPMRVQKNRASDMANFINEYGINKKRNGWNELFRIEDANRNGFSINGIFNYSVGQREEMIVHAGTKFYRVDKSYNITDITASSTYTAAKVDTTLLKNQRSQAFFNKGKMYIIGCGDFLVYGSWNGGATYELRRVVDNEDTFVPTTTIQINKDGAENDFRDTLDAVNMLSTRRKNVFVGDVANSIWTVDCGSIDANKPVFIEVELLVSGELTTKTFANDGSDKSLLYDGVERVGTINFATGKIALGVDTTPPEENKGNITITFTRDVDGYTSRITNCNFGILFGTNGNTDRLFLCGNSDYKNIDFHSEQDDFTYFPDNNTAVIGSDQVAVAAYGRLSDSTMVIYKEDASQEASIFYRNGVYKEYTDIEGNLTSIQTTFPTSAGVIGEGIVSRHACLNFGGDNLILSKNGVFGVVLSENIATNERYARERSRLINEKLCAHSNLSEAVAIIYKNRYYLAVGDVCYIADSRYKYQREDDIDGSYNYEWWYWTNVPVRVWASIDNKLYFGTNDGKVCVFDDEYSDRTHLTTKTGELSFDISTSEITYSKDLRVELDENDIIEVNTGSVYSILVDKFTVKDNRVFVDEDAISNIYEYTEVYLDQISVSGVAAWAKYYIIDVDRGNCSFALQEADTGLAVTISGNGFRICQLMSGKKFFITNISDTSFQVKEYEQGKTLRLASYNNVLPSSLIVTITHKENVVASWYTPIFDLGTNESSKTMLKMTISTESETNGKISFGYETRNVSKLLGAKGVKVFSFDSFSFDDFSFDAGFANSYSIKVNERNFNFIIFRFISDNDSACMINNFTIIYKINKRNRGVA